MIQTAPIETFEILRNNLQRIREQISEASHEREVLLVCVTKYVDAATVAELVRAGAVHIGENRVFEGAAKFESLKPDVPDFTKHLIGPVQSNKAARVPECFDWCQSLSRVKVADILERSASENGKRLNCTIEVNIGEEPQKDGVLPSGLAEFADYIVQNCPTLALRGLMCIPPIADEKGTRGYFGAMRRLFESTRGSLGDAAGEFDTLSMGMSADFDIAIEEGATMVRVGSLLYKGLPGFFD